MGWQFLIDDQRFCIQESKAELSILYDNRLDAINKEFKEMYDDLIYLGETGLEQEEVLLDEYMERQRHHREDIIRGQLVGQKR